MSLRLSDYGYTIFMIETKRVCNMRCLFCAYPLMEKKGSELTSEEVYSLIDSIDPADSRLEGIYLQRYNEPLLDPRIFDFIRYAKGRGFRTQIITNGLPLRSMEIRDRLLAAEPSNVLISMQVINDRHFSRVRGTSCSFEEYKKGIVAFLEDSLNRNSPTAITMDIACNFLSGTKIFSKTGLVAKLCGLDRGDPSVPDTVRDIRGDLVYFLKDLHRYNPSFAFDESDIGRYLETVHPDYLNQAGLPVARNISLKVKKFIYGRKLTEFFPVRNPIGCDTGMLAVGADGSVCPCCLGYDDMLTIGNIKEEPLKNILERTREFVDGIRAGTGLPEVCMRCHGEPTRRGSLVASIYWAFRTGLR